jgi:glycine cleavage system protein P-like pyridoxal-binding family
MLPALDVDELSLDELIPHELQREDDLAGMPEVTEVDVVRHFTRMSTWNYSIDQGMYPLGSCTMKYNSRLNRNRRARCKSSMNFSNTSPKLRACRGFLCNLQPAHTAR